jgi:broad specificity phosphatase PhoE
MRTAWSASEVAVTRILLVRHGQTEWNAGSRSGEHFRGRSDLGLNTVGVSQAQAIARYLGALRVEAIYSSPLQRAIDTARPLARHLRLEIQRCDALLDIDYGEWAGHSHSQVAARWPGPYSWWRAAPYLVQIPGGERLADVHHRAQQGIREITRKHSDGIVVLVSHQAVNRVLICSWLGLGDAWFWRVAQDTGCVNRFDYDGKEYAVLTLNEICHLAGCRQEPPA